MPSPAAVTGLGIRPVDWFLNKNITHLHAKCFFVVFTVSCVDINLLNTTQPGGAAHIRPIARAEGLRRS